MTPVRIEFRGGPRNSDEVTYASWAEVPDGSEHEYLDANIGDPAGPKLRVGRYLLDPATRMSVDDAQGAKVCDVGILGWHIDHAKGAEGGRYVDESKNPADLDLPDMTRPRATTKR